MTSKHLAQFDTDWKLDKALDRLLDAAEREFRQMTNTPKNKAKGKTKEKPQHSPGPWKLRGYSRCFEIVAVLPDGSDSDPLAACRNIGESNEANAYLMAAAPTMYAAIVQALAVFGNDKAPKHKAARLQVCEQLAAAIAAAEGNSDK